jgi:hypothetical protein
VQKGRLPLFTNCREEEFSETRRNEIIDEGEAFMPYALASTLILTAGSYIDVVGHNTLFSYVVLCIAEHRNLADSL